MRGKINKWVCIATVLVALTAVLPGCAYPANYQDWQWKQYNPNYSPLPGDPTR
jgi:hypothetical protein